MKNLSRITLGGLRAIEAVGRLGNLRAAADEIGVTPGAISQQVQKTEAQLGCRLFERRPKGMLHGKRTIDNRNFTCRSLDRARALRHFGLSMRTSRTHKKNARQ